MISRSETVILTIRFRDFQKTSYISTENSFKMSKSQGINQTKLCSHIGLNVVNSNTLANCNCVFKSYGRKMGNAFQLYSFIYSGLKRKNSPGDNTLFQKSRSDDSRSERFKAPTSLKFPRPIKVVVQKRVGPHHRTGHHSPHKKHFSDLELKFKVLRQCFCREDLRSCSRKSFVFPPFVFLRLLQ